MTLHHAHYYGELTAIIEQSQTLVTRAGTETHQTLLDRAAEAQKRLEQDAPLRIALVGEFSAGKSALIAALTGEELAVDADVTTQSVTEYRWQGLVLVDTPGVHADSDPTAHDRMAREATSGADLVLFVVTNELFNQRLADHLRHILDSDGLDLAAKTCVVVNKMDRENNPEAEVLGEVNRVLAPYPDVPVYLCAAGRRLQARQQSNERLAQRFEQQSGMDDLTAGLNRFVADAGASGRLQTPLSLIGELLDTLEAKLAETQAQTDQLELLRRKRQAYEQLEQQVHELRSRRKQEIRNTVLSQANAAIEQVSEASDQAELEQLLEQGLHQAAGDLDAVYDAAESELQQVLSHARDTLDTIDGSSLGEKVAKLRAQETASVRPEAVGNPPKEDSGRTVEWARRATEPLQGQLENLASDPRWLRDVIYDIGKRMGKIFKPWEAVRQGERLSKILHGTGKALPLITSILEWYLEARREKAEMEQAQHLAQVRSALHKAFAEQAESQAQAFAQALEAVAQETVQEGLQALEAERQAITEADTQRQALQAEIGDLRHRCAELRSQL